MKVRTRFLETRILIIKNKCSLKNKRERLLVGGYNVGKSVIYGKKWSYDVGAGGGFRGLCLYQACGFLRGRVEWRVRCRLCGQMWLMFGFFCSQLLWLAVPGGEGVASLPVQSSWQCYLHNCSAWFWDVPWKVPKRWWVCYFLGTRLLLLKESLRADWFGRGS